MDIDLWTLALQAINFFILIVLLRWLFYRPLIAVIDARQQTVDQELANVAAARYEADDQARILADERAALKASREQVMQESRTAAEREREAAMHKTQQDNESALAAARERISRERHDARQAVFSEAASLATSLATQLLARAPVSDVDLAFVNELLTRLQETPNDQRNRWFTGQTPRRVTLASAHDIDQIARQHATDQLKQCLGDALTVDFCVDESLIAGVELRLPHGVVAINWAGRVGQCPICDERYGPQHRMNTISNPLTRDLRQWRRATIQRISCVEKAWFEERGHVHNAADGIARVSGLRGVQLNELLHFSGGRLGYAASLEPEHIECVLLDDTQTVSVGDTVKRSGGVIQVPVGPELLGRVVDPLGRTLDGGSTCRGTKLVAC